MSSVTFSLVVVFEILLPLKDKLPIAKLVAPVILLVLTVSAYTVLHFLLMVPISNVISALGTRLLVRSALIVILSVSASPNVKLPSAVMLPVACMSPVTSTLPFKLIKSVAVAGATLTSPTVVVIKLLFRE